jgi:UDP-N-acetylglucosamine--N-acetylmuramyl-(pentapeptide) pyrophosphoryl-undecaprenol N-acetylglucosamine transferase
MARRIILAGGGTGGHIFPAIAIANAIRRKAPDTEILFVGARGKMEMEKVPQAGYPIEGLDIAGFNRSSLLKNIGLPLKLVKSFLQVRRIIGKFRPQAVIGVGGYSSFPVLRYAQSRGIATFIHESNAFAGRSNQLLGKKATRVFVAGSGMERFFPAERLQVTGNPVRPAIVQAGALDKGEALSFFGLDSGKRTVLVVGGSLGARSINEAVEAELDELLRQGWQLIWQTGKNDASRWKAAVAGKSGVWVNEFITRMELGYAAADVVVSRAGAMALAELCVVKKPVVFVPYPFAAEDHQTANAQGLVAQQAALMVKDSEAKEGLMPVLLALLSNEEEQNKLRTNIGKLAITDADDRIATEILKRIEPPNAD